MRNMRTTITAENFDMKLCIAELKSIVFAENDSIDAILNATRIFKLLNESLTASFNSYETKQFASMLMTTTQDVSIVWAHLSTNLESEISSNILKISLKIWVFALKNNDLNTYILNHGATILQNLISIHQSADEIAMNTLMQLMTLNTVSMDWKNVFSVLFFENGG